MQKTVVITGCDVPSSYAYELALRLDERGYSVFAGCRDCNSAGARSLASRGSTSLAILQMDVTNPDEIKDAAELIEDSVGDEGVWALVNCAELYSVAEVDWCPIEDYEKSIQVNILGTVRITKALLHLVRWARGRIVNLSSIAGCLARAGQSAYSMTKFAIEAFSDSLRQEMLKWGVFVILVEPAFFPVGQSELCESSISASLKTIPENIRAIYGDNYFVDFINSITDSANSRWTVGASNSVSSPIQNQTLGSPMSSTTSGYSSASSTIKSSSDEVGGKPPLPPKPVNRAAGDAKITDSPSSTLKRYSTPNLSNTNRVLHALFEAVTNGSPKVRYFVGSFGDHMVKSLSPMVPTVVMDTYLTSGQMSKVVPKLIKEKMD